MSREPLSLDDVRALIDQKLSRSTLQLGDDDDPRHPTVRHPRTRGGHEIELDLVGLLEAVGASEVVEPAAWIASYLEGVGAVLSAAALPEGMGFVGAAGGIVPRLDGPGFVAGVEAAGGEAPFCRTWQEGLVLTYWVELDRGVLLLSEAQVARWGVTADRVCSAARSLLFHKSREQAPEALGDGVEALRFGDGYDSARVVVLEDLLWERGEVGGVVFGVPSDAALLFCEGGPRGGAVAALRRCVDEAWARASYPLTRDLFHVYRGRVTRLHGGSEAR